METVYKRYNGIFHGERKPDISILYWDGQNMEEVLNFLSDLTKGGSCTIEFVHMTANIPIYEECSNGSRKFLRSEKNTKVVGFNLLTKSLDSKYVPCNNYLFLIDNKLFVTSLLLEV